MNITQHNYIYTDSNMVDIFVVRREESGQGKINLKQDNGKDVRGIDG
jgi:hypothetical protein